MRRTIFEDDHLAFRDSVRTFIQREVLPYHDSWRQQRSVGRELWLAAGRADFLGISIPAAYGGGETNDFRYNVVLTEELARVSLGLSSSVGIHTDVVAPYLVELTTEEQKRRWLPRFCTGELVTAIGMTEAGAGSDLASLRTRARRGDSGWVVNGSKTFITNGTQRRPDRVAARTGPGRRDISLFAVEAASPGFSRGRKLDKIGQHEADTERAVLRGSGRDRGAHHRRARTAGSCNARAAAAGAPARRLREHRARARGAVARRSTTPVSGTRSAGRSAPSSTTGSCSPSSSPRSTSRRRTSTSACSARRGHARATSTTAKAKWWTAQVQNRVIDACVQLHGGYGYMDEYPVARAWVDARVTKIWAGSNEIMKELIGRSLGLGDTTPS